MMMKVKETLVRKVLGHHKFSLCQDSILSKLAFHLASMRNFAELLKEKGYSVDYIYIDDRNNSN